MARRLGKISYRRDDCPAKATHTPSPEGYLQWFAWAEQMSKTHKQRRCPTCGTWAIWEKRRP